MPATRRGFLTAGAASLVGALPGCAAVPARSAPKVVVVGAGFAGTIAAMYVRQWSDGEIDALVECEAQFVSCPLSNLVLGGSRSPSEITLAFCQVDFPSDESTAQLASVHRYDPEPATMRVVPRSSLASAPSAQEAERADAWTRNIRADTLA